MQSNLIKFIAEKTSKMAEELKAKVDFFTVGTAWAKSFFIYFKKETKSYTNNQFLRNRMEFVEKLIETCIQL